MPHHYTFSQLVHLRGMMKQLRYIYIFWNKSSFKLSF